MIQTFLFVKLGDLTTLVHSVSEGTRLTAVIHATGHYLQKNSNM